MMDGQQREGETDRPGLCLLGSLYFWPLLVLSSFPQFGLPFEGEGFSLCKRVGLPWGLSSLEVYLSYSLALVLEVRKWPGVGAHSIACVYPPSVL